uniref:Uncharacterized protein n=1 Tax=Rhizophora mucronata TaxID=61149 RepID=A0A2P2Q1G7_RHIMU
MTDNFGERSSL